MSAEPSSAARGSLLAIARTRIGALVVGVLASALVTVLVDVWLPDRSLRPGPLYIALVALLAATLGLLCGIAAAVSSMVLLWLVVYSPREYDTISLVLVGVCLIVVLLVVWRLELSRQRARAARALSAAAERREGELLAVARALGAAEDRESVRVTLGSAVLSAADASSAAVLEMLGGEPAYDLAAGYDDRVEADWAVLTEAGSPAREAIASGDPVFLRNTAEFAARWSALAEAAAGAGEIARAAVPFTTLGGTRAAITFGFAGSREFAPEDRRFLETLTELIGATLRRIDAVGVSEEGRLARAFDAMLHGVGLHRAIRDPGGAVVDFEVRYMNRRAVTAGDDPSTYIGRSFLESFPAARSAGLFDELVRVVDTGVPFMRDPWLYPGPDGEPMPLVVQITRAATDEVLVVTRDVRDRERDRRGREESLVREARARVVVERLQEALLPDVLPEVAGHSLDAIYRPADLEPAVGGDWYDVLSLPTGELVLVVGDVAGHGMDATATMMFARSSLRALLIEGCQPGEALGRLDRILASQESFVTCWVARYDPTRGCASVASAGHPPAVVTVGRSAILAPAPLRPPLGTGVDAPTTSATLELPRPGLLLAYTDGLVESRKTSIDDGLNRLTDEVTRTFDDAGQPGWLAEVVARVLGARAPADDVCALLVVRSDGPRPG